MIDKWLKAGVLEEGSITYPESGTPQGGVISPLLANIYLHEVLDVWFEREVKPRLRGAAFLIRYADDFVIAFALESDARRVFEVLPKRFERYGLQLHPEKTRLVPFGRPKDGTRPGTFDLLGFTHFWRVSRKGNWVIARKTAKGRLARALHRITQWCKTNRHLPVKDQHKALVRKLTGHFAYYGITGNGLSLNRLRAWGDACVAYLAAASLTEDAAHVGTVPPSPPTLSTPLGPSRPFDLPPRSEPMILKSRMRETRTSGSVGGRGGQPPRSTRHRPS